eukprot:Seg1365.3 transcript_id=Seg1365.3/GoldUCD/mRNA.D3Y31 product="Deoxyuridine 5'-triphosphate nucleotidohydrolase" protein_id=Seg1365.3/GoldUCD/D3Y31
MSEPAAKIARIMPEVAEKEEMNGSNGVMKNEGPKPETNGVHCLKNGSQNGVAQEEKDVTDGSVLLFKKLSEDAKAPVKGSASAAGFDLHSACEKIVPAKGKALASTKLAITVPRGSYGRIAPRSGLASKHFIDVGAGVIDHDYTGEVGVLLFNFSEQDYRITKGERIAQLVIEKIFLPELKEVDELPKTKRGASGYGASGKM